MNDDVGRRVPGHGKPLTHQFADVIVPILANAGPLDTQTLYGQLELQAPALCTDRGYVRPWCVWQRDVRSALTLLRKLDIVELIPSGRYQRKGVYRLTNRAVWPLDAGDLTILQTSENTYTVSKGSEGWSATVTIVTDQ